jgi:aspartate aminotransferase
MEFESGLSQRVKQLKPSPTLATDAKAKALKAQGVDIINFAVGEPDFETPAHIKEAAIQAIRDGFTRYTPVGGIDALKEAIVLKLKDDYNLDYGLSGIMVSTGGKQALYNVAQAIVDPGDEVIIPVPYWVSYPPIVELAGGVPKYVNCNPEKDYALDVDALESAITSRTKAIILNSPSNPTGAVYGRDDLLAVGKLAVKHGIYVISDDIYDAIRFDGKSMENVASVYPEAKDLVLIINGVSKTYAMTGWRIGYLAGPNQVVKAASKIQGQSTSNPNSIAQKAALAAYTGPQDCVKEMARAFFERRDYIIERLMEISGIKCVVPQGAFYVFPDISHYFGGTISDSVAMSDYLLDKARIASVPGIAFGDDRFIRFSYASSIETISEGINRLKDALSEIKN